MSEGKVNDPLCDVGVEVASGLAFVVGIDVAVELLSPIGVTVGAAVTGLPLTLISTVLVSLPSESVTVNVTV